MSQLPPSNVGGDYFHVGNISGTGHGVGKNITIQISQAQAERIPSAYAESLRSFTETVNREIQAQAQPPEVTVPAQEAVQAEVTSLAGIAETVQPDTPLELPERKKVKGHLEMIALGLLRVLPDAARTVAAMTPLAPFGALIGKGLEEIVKSAQEV